MRLSLVSLVMLVVLIYSTSATQLCKESNGSENTSLSNISSSEGLSCVSGQNSNVKSRSEETIPGNNVVNKRSSVLNLDSEIAEDNLDPNDNDENSISSQDNGDLDQNSQGLETGCGDSMGEEMKNESMKRHIKKSCSVQKSANIEKPMAECSSCKMKEDAMKKDVMKEDAMKKEKDIMKDEKPMAECSSGCGMKEDTKKESPPVDKPMTECNACNKKGDAKKESPPPVVIPQEVDKPMTECNACNKKGDAKKESPPPVVIPPLDEPMTECNVCNKKGDAKKESPPPVVNSPMEKPISECSGNVLCNKKDGAIKPLPSSGPISPVAKLPPPISDPMQPTISSPMPSNSTVVIVVENHIAPCSVCGGKVQGGNNSPNSGPVPTGTPNIDAKPPPPPQLQPETKSDSKSGIKPEVKPEIKLDFKPEINQSKAPLPSSAPKPNTEKPKLPIFTGDAITASLRSTTLNIVLLLSLFTTLLNLGGNFLLN